MWEPLSQLVLEALCETVSLASRKEGANLVLMALERPAEQARGLRESLEEDCRRADFVHCPGHGLVLELIREDVDAVVVQVERG